MLILNGLIMINGIFFVQYAILVNAVISFNINSHGIMHVCPKCAHMPGLSRNKLMVFWLFLRSEFMFVMVQAMHGLHPLLQASLLTPIKVHTMEVPKYLCYECVHM